MYHLKQYLFYVFVYLLYISLILFRPLIKNNKIYKYHAIYLLLIFFYRERKYGETIPEFLSNLTIEPQKLSILFKELLGDFYQRNEMILDQKKYLKLLFISLIYIPKSFLLNKNKRYLLNIINLFYIDQPTRKNKT